MKKLTLLLIVMPILFGCASYKARPPPSADVKSFDNYQDQNGLIVGVDFFDKTQSKKLFGVSDVYRKYQPAYIVIDNRTLDTYEFKKRMLNKTTVPADVVADECEFNTAARATAYGVVGTFLFWPLLIPAVVDGVGSSHANDAMENDFLYKEIKDERIPPNGLLSGVVFLEKMKDGEELTFRLRSIQSNNIKLFSFKK